MSRRAKGEGSLYKHPNGNWRAIITINGKRIERQRPTRREAQAALSDLQDLAGVGAVPGTWTVETWIRHWLDTIADLTPATWDGYDGIVRTRINPNIGAIELTSLKPEHLDNFYKAMRLGKHRKNGKPLSKSSIRQTHAIIHRALNVAVNRGHVPTNVADRVEIPEAGTAETVSFEPDTARRVLQQAIADGEGARWAVALMLGLRPAEALGLDWTKLDGDQLTVEQQIYKPRGKPVELLEFTKTDSGRRVITVPPMVLTLLQEQRKKQLEWMIQEGDDWEGWTPPGKDDPVLLMFTTRQGKPLSTRNDTRSWYRILERAGVPKARRYVARHTTASLMLAEGVDIATVGEQLGHKNALITHKYLHALDAKKRAAADKMQQLFEE